MAVSISKFPVQSLFAAIQRKLILNKSYWELRYIAQKLLLDIVQLLFMRGVVIAILPCFQSAKKYHCQMTR